MRVPTKQRVCYTKGMKEMLVAYQEFFLVVSLASLVMFVASLAALPWLVAGIRTDYFLILAGQKDHRDPPQKHPVATLLKNMIGLLVFAMGIIMLFIPGQGLLTMVAGLVIMEFPGKSRVILFLVRKPGVQKGLNWLRQKKGAPALQFPRD